MNSGPENLGHYAHEGHEPGGPDGPDGEQLRQVLTQAADTVDPTEGSLGRVLTRAHQRSVWSWGTPVLAAAAAVLLVAGVGVYAGTRGDDGAQPSSHSPSSSPLTSAPSTSTSPSESAQPSTSTGTGPVHALPVYYAAESDGRAMLYREFHPVRTSQPAQEAIRQAIAVAPVDPDYESLWPSTTTLVSYQRSGSLASVTLSDGPAKFPTAAFQQIVYTVTAADPSVHSVQISYGSITQNPLTRGTTNDTLAPVWLLVPSQGATATSPVTLSGTGMVFEAVVNWEVDTADGTKVASGSSMTPEAFKMGPWSTTVRLKPGHYVAKAFEISAKDGLWTWVDSKAFTVR